MEIHQVRYFLALCEQLNFTRAAETCNVAQPSLTRAIKQLEEELGGPLFHRERQNTHLTELGRTMRPYLATMFEQLEAAKSRAKGVSKLQEGILHLGVMCTIGPARLIDLMRAFQDRYPGIDVQIRDARAAVLQEQILAGDLDIAIFGVPGALDERLHGLPLFQERFMITTAPGHRFEKMNAVPLAELDNERYLSRANCEFGAYVRTLFDAKGLRVNRVYSSERDDWIQAMVLAGLGWGFTPEFTINTPVVARVLIEPEVTRTINIVTMRGRPHSPAVGAFMREATRIKWHPATPGKAE